ncbi:MAG: hypothetical protein OXC66_14765 [Roseovarius sp.]|nr:hypothetical protein [Roseovarius sp.]
MKISSVPRNGLAAESIAHAFCRAGMIEEFAGALDNARKEAWEAFHSAIDFGGRSFEAVLEQGHDVFRVRRRHWIAGPVALMGGLK